MPCLTSTLPTRLFWPRKHKNAPVWLICSAGSHGIQRAAFVPANGALNRMQRWPVFSEANCLPQPYMTARRAMNLMWRRMPCFSPASQRKHVLVFLNRFQANGARLHGFRRLRTRHVGTHSQNWAWASAYAAAHHGGCGSTWVVGKPVNSQLLYIVAAATNPSTCLATARHRYRSDTTSST